MTKLTLIRALAILSCTAGASAAQTVACAPFQPGERFEYGVRVARMGASGHGSMWIEGPEFVRGTLTLVLRFETVAGIGPVRGSDRTASWLDPHRMAALRFTKHERHFLSTSDDSVEMLSDEHRWEAAGGAGGATPTDLPLDELSFIYFVRTLPLADDSVAAFARHFDAARNPQTVRVTGRDTLETKAGRFSTIVVELRVKDPRHYKGDGLIRIHLSDDVRRIPVRIESRMPVFGTTVLTLESYVAPAPVVSATLP